MMINAKGERVTHAMQKFETDNEENIERGCNFK